MVQTYPVLNPYLKGVHGTLDSWRRNRDVNRFRMHDYKSSKGTESVSTGDAPEIEPRAKRKKTRRTFGTGKSGQAPPRHCQTGKKPNEQEQPEPMFLDPEDPLSWEEKFGDFNLSQFGENELTFPHARVRPVKRLAADVDALLKLTESEDAPSRPVRPGHRAHAVYGFGDASKDGFGASIEFEGKGIVWRSGTWTMTMREESSNFREFSNLVETIESLVAEGTLSGHELFMFTDNSTAEAAIFKGTSTSKKLFNLVLQLRKIEMEEILFIHLVHVAGTRMIWSGVDGLSRGNQNAGILERPCSRLFLSLKVPLNAHLACCLGSRRG
jgi:hypothetical protein